MTDLICLGEPLFELSACPDGSFKGGFGGDVSNVAVAAARQGAEVALVTRIGGDQFGEKLRGLWSREDVNHEYVETASGEDTGLYFVFHDDHGHHFVYRRKGSAASRMLPTQFPENVIPNTGMFYTSGISLGVSPELRSTTLHAIQTAHRFGTPIAFDPNLRTALWPLDKARQITHEAMRKCNITLPGLDDARQLTGLHSPEDIINFYHDLGADIVALSLGADGVSVSEGQGIHTIPGVMVQAVDATGAGDCFNGIFLSAYLKSKDVVKSTELANRGAARSTTGYGAVDTIPYGKT
ncbi:sugar kinase [Ruegeria meonggei]|uniref:sugar kinase n=1 Tax=Ruegeria meonggei TaxID=1446476 RepID=UPI00366D28EE